MRCNRWVLLLCVLGMVGVSAPVAGAKPDKGVKLENMAGFVDLGQIEIPAGAEDILDIDLGPSLLKLAAKSDTSGDNKLSLALSQIQSIRVKSFSIGESQTGDVQRHIEEIEARLKADNWHRLIHMKEGNEVISVNALQNGDDRITGLMVMVFEPGDEATFVNVVGEIDLATIMGLAMNMENVDLQELVKELEGN